MKNWYAIEKTGQQSGPLSRDEIALMIESGRLDTRSLLWTEAFGSTWKQLPDTEFGSKTQDRSTKNLYGAEVESFMHWPRRARVIDEQKSKTPIMPAASDVNFDQTKWTVRKGIQNALACPHCGCTDFLTIERSWREPKSVIDSFTNKTISESIFSAFSNVITGSKRPLKKKITLEVGVTHSVVQCSGCNKQSDIQRRYEDIIRVEFL